MLLPGNEPLKLAPKMSILHLQKHPSHASTGCTSGGLFMETTLQDGESFALINSHLHQSWSLFFDFLPFCLLFYPLIWFMGVFKQGQQVRTCSQSLVPSFPCGPFSSPEFACVRIWLLIQRITNNDRETLRPSSAR